MKYKLSTSQHF